MAVEQKFPIKDNNTRLLADAGAYGTFMCDSANPFDAAAFSLANFGPNELYYSYAIKFFSDILGTAPIVATATTNGYFGRALVNEWPSGLGIAVEAEALTMTSGYAEIIMKKCTPIPIV